MARLSLVATGPSLFRFVATVTMVFPSCDISCDNSGLFKFMSHSDVFSRSMVCPRLCVSSVLIVAELSLLVTSFCLSRFMSYGDAFIRSMFAT